MSSLPTPSWVAWTCALQSGLLDAGRPEEARPGDMATMAGNWADVFEAAEDEAAEPPPADKGPRRPAARRPCHVCRRDMGQAAQPQATGCLLCSEDQGQRGQGGQGQGSQGEDHDSLSAEPLQIVRGNATTQPRRPGPGRPRGSNLLRQILREANAMPTSDSTAQLSRSEAAQVARAAKAAKRQRLAKAQAIATTAPGTWKACAQLATSARQFVSG